MTYQQYLDYTKLREAIQAYNSTYGTSVTTIHTSDGDVNVPYEPQHLSRENCTVVITYPIESLPSVIYPLELTLEQAHERMSYIRDTFGLDYSTSCTVTLTEPQFNYLKSGDPDVLRPDH